MIGHCPYCGGVVLKLLEGEVGLRPAVFRAVCPHCKKAISVTLGVAIKVEPVVEKR